MASKKKANTGNTNPNTMKTNSLFLVYTLLLITNLLYGQKFKLETGLGASQIRWYENQITANFQARLSFQKPSSSKLFFIQLNTMGNLSRSLVDKASYTFIVPDNYTNNLDGDLSATYRGGIAELGMQFNRKSNKTKPHIFPVVSLYSLSLARKISTNKTEYVEEEKTALHGVSAGLGWHFPGKTALTLEGQLFQPILSGITLYGRFVGVPYEKTNLQNDLSYRAKLNVKYNKFGMRLVYELLNYGAVSNNKSKSIEETQASMLSSYLIYYF